MKKLIVLAIALAAAMCLASCADDSAKQDDGGAVTSQTEDAAGNADSANPPAQASVPDNEYTKLLPAIPESVGVADAKEIAGQDAFTVTFKNEMALDEIKAYAQALKNNGFSENVMEMMEYADSALYQADSADGIYTVTFRYDYVSVMKNS